MTPISDDMVKAAARSMAGETGDDPDAKTYAREMACTGHDRGLQERWEFWAPLARAALTAALEGSVAEPTSVQSERDRCIAICEGWIGTFQDKDIKYTSAREYAIGAIEDIVDLIRDGHTPTVTRKERSPETGGRR